MLYDAHNHLQDEWLAPYLDRLAADLSAAGIASVVVNGTCEADWPAVRALAQRFPWVRPSYGLHPWDVGNATAGWRDSLRRFLDADPRAALGEIGLDRWILDRARPDDPRLAGLRRAPLDEQRDAFLWQLHLAAARDLPASIHCLDAWGPLTDALEQSPLPPRGFLLHAYAGPRELVARFAARGAYFSFNGSFLPHPPATFHALREMTPVEQDGHGAEQRVARDNARAQRIAQTFAAVPADRLLVETDAPAMPLPAGRRTHTLPPPADGTVINHPANIAAVYAGLAEVLDRPPPALTAQVAENFLRLFGAAAG